VIEGVGVEASSLVGVEGAVGVREVDMEEEREGRVIARRKRSRSGIVKVLLCLLGGVRKVS